MVHKMKNIFITIITYSTIVFSQSFSGPTYNPYNMTGAGSNSAPNFVDINNDGDYDSFTGIGNGFLAFYQNTGSSTSPYFDAWYYANSFGIFDVGNNAKPAFADLDGDGDYDAYIGEAAYTIYYFRNSSSTNPNFTFISNNPFGIANLGANAAPTFVDIDNDGDLDLFTGELYGNIYFYRNLGSSTNPIFSVAFTNPFGLSDVGNYSAPSFCDVDFDGDYDAFIGNQSGDIIFFRNNGTITDPAFGLPITNPFGISNVVSYASPSFVDINNDGKADLFVGTGNGITYYFQNTTVVNVEDVQNSSFVELKAYPNPVGNILNISGKNVDLDNSVLSVYSILGEKLNLNITKRGSLASINFANLAPGIYILTIQSDVVNYSTKIIKGLRGF
jgi:large repetitive protein